MIASSLSCKDEESDSSGIVFGWDINVWYQTFGGNLRPYFLMHGDDQISILLQKKCLSLVDSKEYSDYHMALD